MRGGLVGASVLAMFVAQGGASRALAQQSPTQGGVEEVVVTALKRSDKLQKVPLSIEVLDSKKLEQQQVTQFQDYVKLLPSLAFQTLGPNQTSVYLRGVASGDNANHSGPLPTVGTYLDELPTTTIGGTLDIHVYDIERVEVLPGPQGTLYGASSEAGTLRIITKKPSMSGFAAGYDVQGNSVSGGGLGGTVEGFVNIPLSSNAAVRLVAFDEHDAGYIDNVFGTRTFATSGDTINNAALVKKNFNPADTVGGRAALLIDLNDNWSVLAQVMGQDQRNAGVFAYEPSVGDLQVQRFQPDSYHDRWVQAGLTVTGKIGDYDLTYAGSLFVRDVHQISDYTDYSIFYDAVYGSGYFWQDANGKPLAAPQQRIEGKDHFTKESNEIRLSSPQDSRLRFIVGAFQEQQEHKIIQDYQIQGFGPQISVPGWANTIWLTDQLRTDRDVAAFGELYFDVTPKFQVTGGVRPYYYDNSLKGFFGFSAGYDELTGYSSGQGVGDSHCIAGDSYAEDPCVNLDKHVTGSGETHKFNMSYKIDDQRMVYFTYSTGYRPGGVNRNGDFGGYQADTLTNFEVGLKSSWLAHTLVFNAALYEEDWDQFQFSFLGPNSLTIIQNAGTAHIKGMEAAFDWKPTSQFLLSGGFTLTDAKLGSDYCVHNESHCSGAELAAPEGTALPYTPSFKGNLTARYNFPFFDWDGHVQASGEYQTRNHVGLRTADNATLGSMPAYGTLDLAAGIEKNRLAVELFIKNAFDERGQENRFTPCTIAICGATIPGIPRAVYVYPIQPLTVGLRLSQKF